MDMLTGIASASISLHSSQTATDVNTALLGKVLDTTEEQGNALQEMIDTAGSSHLLDVYA